MSESRTVVGDISGRKKAEVCSELLKQIVMWRQCAYNCFWAIGHGNFPDAVPRLHAHLGHPLLIQEVLQNVFEFDLVGSELAPLLALPKRVVGLHDFANVGLGHHFFPVGPQLFDGGGRDALANAGVPIAVHVRAENREG